MPWETLGSAEEAPAFSGDVNKQRANISTTLGQNILETFLKVMNNREAMKDLSDPN